MSLSHESETHHNADVSAAASGDEIALTRLLMRHHRRLRGIVRRGFRASGELDEEDVLQDALVDIFRSIGSLKATTTRGFIAWSNRIVRNRVAQQHRRNLAKRRNGEAAKPPDHGPVQELVNGLFRQSRSPRSWLANQEMLGLLPLWLSSLDELPRRVILMKYVDQRDYRSIGLELGKTPEAVRMMVMRSLRLLRGLAVDPVEKQP